MARCTDNEFGLIILGNSGVGKSFLANVLLGREAFKHELSVRSVTHRTEFQEIQIDDHRYAIFDIPGLIEADQAQIEINKCEIDHAFIQRPNSLIIFVFGQQNGRIHDEDAVAFNAINAAYPLNIESLLIVINGLPVIRPENYEGEVILMLQKVISVPPSTERVCFLNHININNFDERQALRNQLLQIVVELTPTEHIKTDDIHLEVDEVAKLRKQIQEMKKTFQLNKIYFEEKIREQQQCYDELVATQKSEADHFRRIIERQVEENKKTRETHKQQFETIQQAHESHLSMMKTQTETIQEEHQKLVKSMMEKSKSEIELVCSALEKSSQMQEELQKKITDLQKSKENSCFVAGSLVRMADGTEKPIEKIEAGDVVLGIDHQSHVVMFLDVEQLQDRYLYGLNDLPPFFTGEHVFLTHDGAMVAVEPQASENEEPSLRGLIKPLCKNVELQTLDQDRPSSIVVHKLSCVMNDPSINVYNVVLESGHLYYVNGFCAFDMFPNLSRYPRMFKFLHLLWRNCATEIDAHFDDTITPGSIDRLRLDKFAEFIQEAISNYLSKK